MAERFSTALGVPKATVIKWWRYNRDVLLKMLVDAGINPNTGLPIDAGGSHEPGEARASVQTITEGAGDNLPATGVLERHGGDDAEHDPVATRAALAALGAVVTPKRPDDLGDDADGQHATLEHVRRGA
jgi:hypothetical protein